MERIVEIIKKANEIGRNLPSLASSLPTIPERKLEYREGAYGITELLSCPKKAEIRRELQAAGIELPIESQEIEDGFLFEGLVKLACAVIYGDKFTPEKVLPYDLEIDGKVFKIDGHLDVFIEDGNRITALELKHTNLNFDNTLSDRPPQFILLDPNDRKRININFRYYQQVKIQRFILKKLFPEKEIETYLVVKTQLRTKHKLGKTTVILPVTEEITEEELKNLCRAFMTDKNPRAEWECFLCPYKKHGYCSGTSQTTKVRELCESKKELIEELLTRRAELLAEVSSIEEQLKKLINGSFYYGEKEVGWVTKEYYEYDLPKLAQLIKKRGLKVVDFVQLKRNAGKKLEELLGEEIESVREKKERKRFILP